MEGVTLLYPKKSYRLQLGKEEMIYNISGNYGRGKIVVNLGCKHGQTSHIGLFFHPVGEGMEKMGGGGALF